MTSLQLALDIATAAPDGLTRDEPLPKPTRKAKR